MAKKTETTEDVLCKIMKTDPKTWQLIASDSSSSLIAELNLKEKTFNFNYSGGELKNDDCTVKIGVDRQRRLLDLQYKGKDLDGSLRTLSVGLPLGGPTFSIESRETVIKTIPEEILGSISQMPEEREKVVEAGESGKVTFKETAYRTFKSAKYIPVLEKLLDKDNKIRKSEILERLTSRKERIGISMYLSTLKKREVVTESGRENNTVYTFLKPSESSKAKYSKRVFDKESYPTILAGMITGENRVLISDIDKAFHDGIQRRSVKLFINKNYLNKKLASKDSSGTFYVFNPGVLPKSTST